MILILSNQFRPDFEEECKKCGTSPCVVHGEEETELCGPCYFEDPQMLDYWLWNDFDTTYLPTIQGDSDDD